MRGVLALGRAVLLDSSAGVQTAQVQIGPLETHDGVPDVAHYGFTSAPQPSARYVIGFVAGDRANPVAIGSNDAASRKTGLQRGEVAIYSDLGQTVYLTRTGIVIDGAGLPMTIQNTPTLTVTGDIRADGAIIAGYGSADQVGLQTHTHPSAPSGAPSAPTAGS